jgi:hypothetical protein
MRKLSVLLPPRKMLQWGLEIDYLQQVNACHPQLLQGIRITMKLKRFNSHPINCKMKTLTSDRPSTTPREAETK